MNLNLSLPPSITETLVRQLETHGVAEVRGPRPVHVVYGGAHLFRGETPAKLGKKAREALATWAGDAATFGEAVGVTDPALAEQVLARVRDKLEHRPIEALCIDFEDGYGPRSDAEEDAEAVRAASELAMTKAPDVAIGMRIKALSGATTARSIRTLDLFVTTLARETNGALAEGFTVTLPKVTSPAEVTALASLLDALERALGISRPISVELMVETPRALLTEDGLSIPRLIAAAKTRVCAVHLGAYDLTAELGVTGNDQRLDHPYCDFARLLLRMAAAGSSLGVSDGATTTLPIPPKNASEAEAREAVRNAWKLHALNVRRSIEQGIFQGWDLHPAQIPARYGALFGYFLANLETMTTRLQSFIENATKASRVGQAFDDAATGQGLMSFFARGIGCGALSHADLARTTLAPQDLSRSFAELVKERAAARP